MGSGGGSRGQGSKLGDTKADIEWGSWEDSLGLWALGAAKIEDLPLGFSE